MTQTDPPPSKRRGRPPGSKADRDEGFVTGSLARGLLILDVLREAVGPLALSDVAAETGLEASTAHRLLQVLAEQGYAVRDEKQKRYLPGPRALSPLTMYHPFTQLRNEAAPVLKMLHDETGEVCALVLFVGNERMVVDSSRGGRLLSPYYDTWLRSPLHASASGKLLLAWMGDAERNELLGPGPYTAHTPYTITDPAELAADLQAVRDRGFAVAREDAFQNLVALAVPLALHPDAPPLGCLVVTSLSRALNAEDEPLIVGRLKSAASLFSHMVPAMQSFKAWAPGRLPRRAPG